MIFDAYLRVSNAQALTASADSTNTIDMGVDAAHAEGEHIAFAVTTDVAADVTTGDETYTVVVYGADSSDFSDQVAIETHELQGSELLAGGIARIGLDSHDAKRYYKLRYNLAGTTPSITVTAHLTLGSGVSPVPHAYPNGYTVG